MQKLNLEKCVLISGAGKGIGRVTTEYLAQKGFKIYAGARKDQDLRDLEKIDNVKSIKLDITEDEDVKTALEFIQNENKGLFGLINNAAIPWAGPCIESTIEEIKDILDVNLLGVHRLTKTFFPLLRESNGRIVMISSIGGLFAYPFTGLYSISKFALETYSNTLRRELIGLNVDSGAEAEGIKVSIVNPGQIKTPMREKIKSLVDQKIEENPDSLFKNISPKMKDEVFNRTDKNAISALEVAKAIYRALTDKKPKIRYLVGISSWQRALLKVLPERRTDKMVKNYFKKLLKS
ncbi:MAG: SDR family oxidoreductase [Candidatus Lokiarchaeota archaeon]|nr:SDR family oxidoreductase [Candidatus Lokiarchaeota archaeon]